MGDEIKHSEAGSNGGDGSSNGGQHRSRAERREFADVILAWAAAIASMRSVLEGWEQSISALQTTGGTLVGLDRDRKVADLLNTTEQMHVTEELSAETRAYLDAIATRLRGLSK